VWLGGKLLDLAESLPETKRGPIHHLQMIRGFQRKNAAEARSDAKPPGDSRLAISAIRLVEAYSIENFNRLRLALQRLFPDFPRQDGRSGLLTELDQSIRSLTAGGWWNIGIVVRERGRYSYALPVRELPRLPPQIESIHVSIGRVAAVRRVRERPARQDAPGREISTRAILSIPRTPTSPQGVMRGPRRHRGTPRAPPRSSSHEIPSR
jgi:hypothetical protein